MLMKKKDVIALFELLQQKKAVALTCHENPDGDAIGSAVALHLLFQQLGVPSTIIIPGQPPKFLHNLIKERPCVVFNEKEEKCKTVLSEADLVFYVDFNAAHRTGKNMGNVLSQLKSERVLIDHHLYPDSGFVFSFSDTSKSSTAELVFDLIVLSEHVDKITPAIADALYTGLMTDTGNFAYSSNNPSVFKMAQVLVEKGVQPARLFNQIYNTYPEQKLRLFGFAIYERLTVFPEYGTAYIALSREDLRQFGYAEGFTEGLVNYTLSIEGIKFGCLIRENIDNVSLSFRSKGSFSVNEFANKHFNGGGHRNAAGGRSYLPLEETITKFEKIFPLYKNEIFK